MAKFFVSRKMNMVSKQFGFLLLTALGALSTFCLVSCNSLTMRDTADYRNYQPEHSTRKGEDIEWGICYAYNKLDESGAQRVLVIGDSICNAYHRPLRTILGRKMNVTFWASSLCVTDPLYFKALDLVLDGPEPQVVLFNNALHSCDSPDAEWRAAFIQALRFIRARLPQAKIAVVNSTPVRDNDPAVVARSRMIDEVAAEMGVSLVDIYACCDGWPRETAWSDEFHFKPEYVQKQAEFLAPLILRMAGASEGEGVSVVQKANAMGPDGRLE